MSITGNKTQDVRFTAESAAYAATDIAARISTRVAALLPVLDATIALARAVHGAAFHETNSTNHADS